MREMKQYVCEGCGTPYADKTKAQECEKNHKAVTTVLQQRFLPKSSDASGYPIRITVKMADGKEVVYKR